MFEVPDQTHRRPEQIYVMGLQESPKTTTKIDYDGFSGFFNWTMTYRLDSDIPHPYGRMVPRSAPFSYAASMPEWVHVFNPAEFAESLGQRPKEFRALAHRPKAVAWIVSHCDTKSEREKYVEELQKHIEVDIFGACGKGRCDQECDHIERDYMFYLSFENSLCDHYVTEKLWNWLNKSIVPVVMGQTNYSAIVPPHSIINVMDFAEPADLASHLKGLMSSETEYLSHFWWKDFYMVAEMRSPAYCMLCQMLHEEGEEKLPPKVVDHLEDWWVGGGHCKSEGTHPWS